PTKRAHLVLEQLAERLEQLEAQALREPADVVVALDRRRGSMDADGFDDVGIERPLNEEIGAADSLGLLFEDLDERVADALALDLRVRDARQVGEEARA